MIKKLGNWFRGLTVATGLLLGSYFSTPAYGQDDFNYVNEDNRARQEQTEDNEQRDARVPSPADSLDDRVERSHDWADGYVRGGGHYTPDSRGVFGEGALRFNVDNWFNPTFYGLANRSLFDVVEDDAPNLNLTSYRLVFGNGMSFRDGETELYVEPQLGHEWSEFTDNIDIDSDRLIFGGSLGVRSGGTWLRLNGWGGTGSYDGQLRSGHPVSDDFRDLYLGVDFFQLLDSGDELSLGKHYRTNWFDDAEIVNGFKDGWTLGLNLYYNNSDFRNLLESEAFGGRAVLQRFDNWRSYRLADDNKARAREEDLDVIAEGWMGRYGLAVQADLGNSQSGVGLRETDMQRYRMGVTAGFEYVTKSIAVSIALEAGYQLSWTDIDDPGQGVNNTYDQHGGYVGATLGFGW